jgi:hypothetical protein
MTMTITDAWHLTYKGQRRKGFIDKRACGVAASRLRPTSNKHAVEMAVGVNCPRYLGFATNRLPTKLWIWSHKKAMPKIVLIERVVDSWAPSPMNVTRR